MHSGDVVSECGYFIFYRVVSEEIDCCISGVRFSEYISILVGIRIRNRSEKFICPLFSYVGLNFMSSCVWFMFVVIRSGCILLVIYNQNDVYI